MIDLVNDRQPLFAAPARVLADSPDKLVNEVNETHMRLAKDLVEIIRAAEKEVIFISPYYVPGDGGVRLARELVEKGLRVVVLTNSLASTNHVPVHAGYAKYRRDVIGAGVELYEARANAVGELNDGEDGPEKMTLHTKVFIIDRKKIFIGSMNLDPRSIELNAEMGILIESEAMIASLMENSDENLASETYRVLVNEKGNLEWHTTIDGRKVVETKEPLTSRWLRFKAWFTKIAPESQL